MTMHTPPQPNAESTARQGHRYPPPPPPDPSVGSGHLNGSGPRGFPSTTAQPAKPSAHWALSIVAVLCSLLFGGIGLYFSTQVTTRWANGDVEGAQKASKTALVLDLVGIAIGVVLIVAALSSTSTSTSTDYYY